MDFGRLPVLPRESDVPLIPSNKWSKKDDALIKIYNFRFKEQRNDFVRQILIHEETVGHNAVITVKSDSVALRLQTEDVRQITELDKEYAKVADELYKDIVYSLTHD